MCLRMLFIFLLVGASFYCRDAFSLTTPSISANALFLYRNSNFHKDDINPNNPDQTPNGLDVQEAELQVYSDVDPYTRLQLLLSISPKFVGDTANNKVNEQWGIEPEEAFADSNVIPDVTFKIGKFKAFMGKHNMMHTHAYPFIEAPLAHVKLMGDEGLNDAGLSAAILMPTKWFNELTLQYLRGKGENDEFNSPSPGGGVGLAHWKNLFDLSDDLTMEVGASYAQGGNIFRQTTSLTGADLTFKWRPAEGGMYHSILWATEYLARDQAQSGSINERGGGIATWIQYQFGERWAALYRYDTLGVKNSFDTVNLPNTNSERHSVALNYSASEFSSFKIEYFQTTGGAPNSSNENVERAVFVQANFTIGAHPAHAY